MKRLLNSVAAVVLLGWLASVSGGCVQVQSHPYVGVDAFSPTSPETVAILRTPPTKPHLRLGEITVEPKGNTSVQTIEQKFQMAGAKMGANAVVIVADKTEVMGIQETGPWYNTEVTPVTGRVIIGVAIRYVATPPQVQAEPRDANDHRGLATAARAEPHRDASGG